MVVPNATKGDNMLCCTADRPGGWNHSTENNHYEQTITLTIFRFEGNVLVKHPRYGTKWSYRRAKDKFAAMERIRAQADKIGLQEGSLVHYVPKTK